MSVKNETHYLFWRGAYSQWYMSDMYDPKTGLIFCCCEQYMMYKKAELFDDKNIMQDVMCTEDPREIKALGRLVQNYDDAKWNEVCRIEVAYGNYLKFSQKPDLLKLLYKYKDLILVEASPYDPKWGIGLAEDHPDALDPTKWKGLNWLGEAIMDARDLILNGQGHVYTHLKVKDVTRRLNAMKKD
jgi:hypothetical protein